MDRVQLSSRVQLQSHYKETVCFEQIISQELLGLSGSNSERQKAELTLEPPSGSILTYLSILSHFAGRANIQYNYTMI